MRALAIVHQPDAGPGVFTGTLQRAGWALDQWSITAGEPPPADPREYDAVIALGAAAHVDEDHPWLAQERALLAELLGSGAPLLGVCLGAELLAQAAGGAARRAERPEIGWHRVSVRPAGVSDPLLGPLADGFDAFSWHSYECRPPLGAMLLADSPDCLQAFRLQETAWGIQFHAEVTAADAAAWIRDYAADPDAVRAGVDPRRLLAETEPRIERWNDLGAELCRRFAAEAARLSARRSR